MPTGHTLPLGPSFGLREPYGLSSTSVRCAHPPGKSPLLPIFERGSSQCRAQHCWTVIPYYRARSCSLFSSFKKGGPFSLRCLSPLGSPAVGAGQTQPMRVGMLHCSLDGFAAQKTVLIFSSALGTMPTQPALLRILRSILDILAHKMPARNQIHAGIFCEPEGLSPDGGLIYSTNRKPHQTGEPRGLSPSGGKTPANLLSLQYPRALWARCGVQGFSPAACRRP